MRTEEQKTIVAIAKEYDLCEATVIAVLHRNGLRSRNWGGKGSTRKYVFTAEQEQEMVRRYEAGQSCSEIAAAFSIDGHLMNTRLRQLGVKMRYGGYRAGKRHLNWVGGRTSTGTGYMQVMVDAHDPLYVMAAAHKDGSRYVLEHRLVMARHLGRPLHKLETVHHIDGNRCNNDISNLELRWGAHGKGVVLVCAECGSKNLRELGLA